MPVRINRAYNLRGPKTKSKKGQVKICRCVTIFVKGQGILYLKMDWSPLARHRDSVECAGFGALGTEEMKRKEKRVHILSADYILLLG